MTEVEGVYYIRGKGNVIMLLALKMEKKAMAHGIKGVHL